MTTDAAPLHERLQALAIEAANAASEADGNPSIPAMAGWMLDPSVPVTAGWLQKLAYALSDASREAQRDYLSDGVLTAAQQRRIARLFESGHVRELRVVSYAPFDLPTGWIMVVVQYASGAPVTGGISPDGEMNT